MRQINLPEKVEYIINELGKNGYEAYVVGGSVRDSIMGKTPHDWDITTDATPDEIKEVFWSFPIIETGIKHGTVTVVIAHNNYEITTYRVDGEYSDGRRPDNVSFTRRLSEDLKRRDFTINAIAYNLQDGFVDYYGGISDIKNKVIRSVGNPDKRFQEDALRLLRATRFAATLGFDIEDETRAALKRNKELLNKVSRERITNEIVKTLKAAQNFTSEFIELVRITIPEIDEDYVDRLMEFRFEKDLDYRVKLAILFFGIPNIDSMMRDMKFSNKQINSITGIYAAALMLIFPHDLLNKEIARFTLRDFGEEITTLAALYLKADDNVDFVDVIKEELDFPYDIKDLKINGNDLLKAGYEGREIYYILRNVSNYVIKEEIKNDRDVLLEFIASLN